MLFVYIYTHKQTYTMTNISNNARTAIIEGILSEVGLVLSFDEAGIVYEDNEITLICSLNFSSGEQKYFFQDEDGEEQQLSEVELQMIYEHLYDALEDHRQEYCNSEWEDIQEDNLHMSINYC